MQFIQDPSLAGNPGAAAMQPVLIAHIAEHVALLYRTRMEAGVGVPLPPVPDFKSTEYEAEDIDPALDKLISQRAAQVVQQAPVMKQIDAITAGQQGQQGDPLQYAQQLAQLETEALKARTEAQIAADQAKAQSSIQIKQAEAQQDLQIEAAKAKAELESKIVKLEAELQLEREKNASKIQMEREKNAADIQMEVLKGE
jgi:hypothetical protein